MINLASASLIGDFFSFLGINDKSKDATISSPTANINIGFYDEKGKQVETDIKDNKVIPKESKSKDSKWKIKIDSDKELIPVKERYSVWNEETKQSEKKFYYNFYSFSYDGKKENRIILSPKKECKTKKGCDYSINKKNVEINYFGDSNLDVYNVSGCRTLNDTNTVYYLNQSISNVSTDCFIVQANNVTLNGMGYKVTANNISLSDGIYNVGYNDTTIMNITLDKFGSDDFNGGCTFAYSYDGEKFNPEFALNDFSVMKEWEGTVYGILPSLKKINNQYHVGLFETVPETQYLDEIKLVKLIHNNSQFALPTQDGNFNLFNKKVYPTAIDKDGNDFTSKINNADENYYISNLTGLNYSQVELEPIFFNWNLTGDINVGIRAKETGLLYYGWRQTLTLIEGHNLKDYELTEEYKARFMDWAIRNGFLSVFYKNSSGDWEYLNYLEFGNVDFYHTYSFNVNSTNNLELMMMAVPYMFQIDEIYADNTTESYTIKEMNISESLSKVYSDLEVKNLLSSSDENYLDIDLQQILHLWFNDTDTQNGTLMIKSKGWSKSYTFYEGVDKAQYLEKDLSEADKILTDDYYLRETYIPFFKDNYEIKTSLQSELDLPDELHSGMYFQDANNIIIKDSKVNNSISIFEPAIDIFNVSNIIIDNFYTTKSDDQLKSAIFINKSSNIIIKNSQIEYCNTGKIKVLGGYNISLINNSINSNVGSHTVFLISGTGNYDNDLVLIEGNNLYSTIATGFIGMNLLNLKEPVIRNNVINITSWSTYFMYFGEVTNLNTTPYKSYFYNNQFYQVYNSSFTPDRIVIYYKNSTQYFINNTGLNESLIEYSTPQVDGARNSTIKNYWGYWYDGITNLTNGSLVNANLSIYNNQGFFANTTSLNGIINQTALYSFMDFINITNRSYAFNATANTWYLFNNRTDYNNYTINATYSSSTLSHSYNLTLTGNIFDVFTFSLGLCPTTGDCTISCSNIVNSILNVDGNLILTGVGNFVLNNYVRIKAGSYVARLDKNNCTLQFNNGGVFEFIK